MTPLTLAEVADRQRQRAEMAITLAEAADATTLGPSELGNEFWRIVARECELCHALLASATPHEATLLADRAMLTLALRENTARSSLERAALQTVLHELRLDLACWRDARSVPQAVLAPN